jgi:ribonuclease D
MAAAWIERMDDLTPYLGKLQASQPLAFDTEADSMHHYEESVCLVTVGQAGTTLLIDSLVMPDLSSFWSMASACEWILHGADFDLRLMRRVGAQEPPHVFDTMLAAQLCGIKSFGYAALVEQFFAVKLDKGSQREDWSQRPLPPEMLEYAAQDVAYLEGLRDKLGSRLAELGRTQWHLESCQRVMQTSRITREEDPDEIWRIGYTNKLPGSTQAIVRALWHWRDREAEEQDVPHFKVMNNERLLEFAEWAEANRDAAHLPGFYLARNCRGERLERLKEALAQGRESSPVPPQPRVPRPKGDPEAEKRADLIKAGRDLLAQELELDPSLIASRLILTALARDPRDAPAQLIQELRWCPWQASLLQPLLADL